MNSSTGFKKRSLLRPASGLLNKEKEFLKAIDISQGEQMVIASLRAEIANIQEYINLLDKDRRIRTGEVSLDKSYSTVFKKWLRETQMITDKEEDDAKVLRHMSVESYEAGFKKLWKLFSAFDLMVTKITELQVVQFLLYDDMYSAISEDSQRTGNLLLAVSKGGFSSGLFQITQVILDRNKDLFAYCNDAKRKYSTTEMSKNQDNSRAETNELIKTLRKYNDKLNALLEQMNMERMNEKNSYKHISDKHNQPAEKRSTEAIESSKDIFKDLEEKYREHLKQMSSEKAKAEQELRYLQVSMSSIQTQLKMAYEQRKNEYFRVKGQPKAGSYEYALVEYMQKMKKGFEAKMAFLIEDFANKEKEMHRKEADYKTENNKIKWYKSLLLKKFESLRK